MAEALGVLLLTGVEVTTFSAATAFGTLAVSVPLSSIAVFGTGITIGSIVGTAALFGASVAAAYILAPNVPKPGDGSQPLRQPIPPRPFGYGRARISGSYMLYEVDPNTLHSWDVLALHQGRIGGVVHYYLHDDMVGLDGAGRLNAVLNCPNDGRYDADSVTDGDCIIKVNLGLPTETAFSDVVAVLPSLWSNAHRGDGVASLMLFTNRVAVNNVLERFPRGLPRPSVVADLSPIWDPRDPAQDRDDPDTWEVSSNPVLQMIDYLTQDRGPGLDYDTVIAPVLAAWMAEADACDEPIDKADGSTEPRYKSDGWALLTTDPADVIAAILVTCDGWMTENGDGTLTLKVGKYTAPEVTITDDHIVGYSLDKGVADEEIINEVQFSYCAPANNYRDAPGVAWRDEAAIAEMGQVKSQQMTMAWVQSHSQGRRLAKRAASRHQAGARGQLVTTLYGLKALGKRWLKVQSRTVEDLANAVVEITRANIDLANGRVTFDWFLINPNEIDAWDPETEEGTPPTFFPLPEDAVWSDGTGGQIQVAFSEPTPTQPWLDYLIDYRTGTSGPWSRTVVTSYTPSAGTITLLSDVVAAGTYQVRLAVLGPQGHTNDLVWTDVDSVVIA